MSSKVNFTIDGRQLEANAGEMIIQAADRAGIYIPRLCYRPELKPRGTCRICTVLVNGRPQSACTHPIAANMVVENDTPELQELRRSIVEMLFVEGNHFCMVCEKSGNCELQALAYRFGVTAPRYPFMFPVRDVDASHPEVFLDRNRCVMCGRCVSASKELDGRGALQFIGRGPHKRIGVSSGQGLGGTALRGSDAAASICPVGALLKKRVGYAVPIGRREYDKRPIGAAIEEACGGAPDKD